MGTFVVVRRHNNPSALRVLSAPVSIIILGQSRGRAIRWPIRALHEYVVGRHAREFLTALQLLRVLRLIATRVEVQERDARVR